MSIIRITKTVEAPIDAVWDSWDDFGNIAVFNPNVVSSRLLSDNSAPTGVGTRRECELTGGKHYLRERLTGYTPGREMTIELYESSLPLKRMTAILQLTEMSDTATEVSFVAEFAPKGGLFGRLVQPLMKRRFAAMLRAMLNGNAEYIENNMRAALAA